VPDLSVISAALDRIRRERNEDEIVPAAFGPPAHTFRPADDQAVGSARHCDIEKPAIFILGGTLRALARVSQSRHVVLLRCRPGNAIRHIRACSIRQR
jgi:hypothetical protein